MSVICFVRQSVHSKSVQAGKGRIPIVGKHFELNISKFWYGGRLNPKAKKNVTQVLSNSCNDHRWDQLGSTILSSPVQENFEERVLYHYTNTRPIVPFHYHGHQPSPVERQMNAVWVYEETVGKRWWTSETKSCRRSECSPEELTVWGRAHSPNVSRGKFAAVG